MDQAHVATRSSLLGAGGILIVIFDQGFLAVRGAVVEGRRRQPLTQGVASRVRPGSVSNSVKRKGGEERATRKTCSKGAVTNT